MTILSFARPTCTTTSQPKPRRRVRRIAAWSGGLVAFAVTAFVAAPSPIHPLAWSPAPAPALTGVLAPNEGTATSTGFTPEQLAVVSAWLTRMAAASSAGEEISTL